MLPITWSFRMSGFPRNLDHPSSHVLRMTEWLQYHKTCNNSHMCNMAINIGGGRPWVFSPHPLPLSSCSPMWIRASSFFRFRDHTQRRTSVGRTPLYEPSARRRDCYLTTHNIHNRQTDIHALGGIRTHNLSRRAAADLFRPRGHWDRLHGY